MALTDNAADPQQVREARKQSKKQREQQLSDIRAVLRSGEGRRVFWRVLEYCGTLRSIFDRDPGQMAYNAGVQDVGHFVMAELEAAEPRALERMRGEFLTATQAEERRLEESRTQETAEQ